MTPVSPRRSRRDELRNLVARSRLVVFWSAATGVATGLMVAGFDRLTVNVVLERVRNGPLLFVAFAPGLGLLLATLWLRGPGRGVSPATADSYLAAYHGGGELEVRPALHRVIASFATLAFGGAMGLEGPSLYMGATTGAWTQRRFGRFLPGADRNVLMVAGAAAGVAAIFKAPATGAIFALEVPYQDDLARRMLLPALVASAAGYLSFVAVNGTKPLFAISGTPPFSFKDLAGAVLLGVTAGVGARAFAWLLRRAKALNNTVPVAWRVLGATAVLAGLFAIARGLTGRSLTIGPGYEVIGWALSPNRSVPLVLAVLLVRCVATATVVGGGGAGGLFVPLVVAGALLGRVFGGAFGDQTSLFVVIGVAAFLGAGYRVPLAAVMFVAESTGRPGFVVPGLLAAVAAELVMGRSSVTAYQSPPPLDD
ncbi:MAG: putative H(+)/Cl(-) exchange transporter [Actinomycetia bacterium]|nr:putative H(+)/Cl(-) exchange transporter [Actinomycetes bacterium]